MRDYFEKPRRRDLSAVVTDAANELRRRLTEYSQYVRVYLACLWESLTLREPTSSFILRISDTISFYEPLPSSLSLSLSLYICTSN